MTAHDTSAHDGLLRVGCKDVRLTSDQAAAGVYCRFPNGKRALAKVEHESQTLVCDAPKVRDACMDLAADAWAPLEIQALGCAKASDLET